MTDEVGLGYTLQVMCQERHAIDLEPYSFTFLVTLPI